MGVGACAWLLNHISSHPSSPYALSRPSEWAASFFLVAAISLVWLRAHDLAFAQEVEAKQRARLASDLAAAAKSARAGAPPENSLKSLTSRDRAASLPFDMYASLLANDRGRLSQAADED